MKQINTNQEILLFTGTSFTNRELCSRENEKDNIGKASPMEELERACWDGMLNEMFPKIKCPAFPQNENYIWKVMPGIHFLRINMGGYPPKQDYETTLDPYFFMLSTYEN